MKISIPKTALVAALTRCAAVAHDKASLPILTHVLIEALPGSLRIHATDLEVGYSTVIDNIVWLGGGDEVFSRYTLPAKKLLEIAKAIPVDMIDLTNEDDHIFTISGGTASFVLHGLDPSEYPVVTPIEGEEVVLTAAALHEAIFPVVYCQSKNADKPNLNGIKFQLEENVEGDLFIVTAATDGHRLCLNTVPVAENEDEPETAKPVECNAELAKGVTIPSKAVAEILHLGTTGLAVLTMAGGQLCVSIGDERLTLRLLEGEFPDINRVIPKNQTSRIIVKRQALLDSIARVRIATDKENMRGVNMETEDGRINLSSTLPMQGVEARDSLSAEIIDTPPALRFCSEYLQQALTNIQTAEIEMHFIDAMSPMLILPHGTDFPQSVIMPMRGN